MNTSQPQILIVDDDFHFRNLLCKVFEKEGWLIQDAKDGHQALTHLQNFKPDIIIMDIEMPARDGISTCRIIRTDLNLRTSCPVILMGTSPDKRLISQAIEAGCDDFILKPFSFDILLKKVEKLIEFQKRFKKGEKEKTDYQKEEQEAEIIVYSKQVIKKAFSNAMKGKLIDYPVIKNVVTKMIEIVHKEKNIPLAYKMKSHNDYTYIHSINVASLCMSFAYHLKWNDDDLQFAGEAGFLHDIGKTKVDPQILMKPAELNKSEFSKIKKHVLLAKDILSKQKICTEVIEAAVQHHEHIDGNGYPQKLRYDQIGKFGKMLALIDSYDALTTDQCYKRGVESKEAVQVMAKEPGHFDPKILNKFTNLICSDTIGK